MERFHGGLRESDKKGLARYESVAGGSPRLRVLITGLGAVTVFGQNAAAVWRRAGLDRRRRRRRWRRRWRSSPRCSGDGVGDGDVSSPPPPPERWPLSNAVSSVAIARSGRAPGRRGVIRTAGQGATQLKGVARQGALHEDGKSIGGVVRDGAGRTPSGAGEISSQVGSSGASTCRNTKSALGRWPSGRASLN